MNEPLTCACCQGPLNPDDAELAPDGVPMRFLFHRDLAICWRIRKARAMAWHPSKSGLNDPAYTYEKEAVR